MNLDLRAFSSTSIHLKTNALSIFLYLVFSKASVQSLLMQVLVQITLVAQSKHFIFHKLISESMKTPEYSSDQIDVSTFIIFYF